VDGVILDLEDAVLPAGKLAARAAVLAAAAARHFGRREVIIRITGLDTEWGLGDLRAAATSLVDGILLSKVDEPATLLAAARVLDELAAPPGLRLWSMAETPRAVLDMDAIARCTPRLGAIVAGTADLGKALRVPEQPGRAGLVPALAHCVLAARAAGLDILDGVYVHLTDPAGSRAGISASMARPSFTPARSKPATRSSGSPTPRRRSPLNSLPRGKPLPRRGRAWQCMRDGW
jgi:citrate lyase subunit beta/citryl-CoA lyase